MPVRSVPMASEESTKEDEDVVFVSETLPKRKRDRALGPLFSKRPCNRPEPVDLEQTEPLDLTTKARP
uniref:Uncharacterized protein n=1 Tax=Bat mastadenovirus TaxID=740971 RepID=A0A894JBX3_9ADEN|nr:hypothetical protein [Bat mastadenovirus]